MAKQKVPRRKQFDTSITVDNRDARKLVRWLVKRRIMFRVNHLIATL